MMSPYVYLLWPPDPTVVEKAARRTAGEVVHNLGGSMASQVKAILDTYRQSYVIRYQPQGVATDGWHVLQVRVNRPGSFEVTARRGYFGG